MCAHTEAKHSCMKKEGKINKTLKSVRKIDQENCIAALFYNNQINKNDNSVYIDLESSVVFFLVLVHDFPQLMRE